MKKIIITICVISNILFQPIYGIWGNTDKDTVNDKKQIMTQKPLKKRKKSYVNKKRTGDIVKFYQYKTEYIKKKSRKGLVKLDEKTEIRKIMSQILLGL